MGDAIKLHRFEFLTDSDSGRSRNVDADSTNLLSILKYEFDEVAGEQCSTSFVSLVGHLRRFCWIERSETSADQCQRCNIIISDRILVREIQRSMFSYFFFFPLPIQHSRPNRYLSMPKVNDARSPIVR